MALGPAPRETGVSCLGPNHRAAEGCEDVASVEVSSTRPIHHARSFNKLSIRSMGSADAGPDAMWEERLESQTSSETDDASTMGLGDSTGLLYCSND